MIMMVKLDSIGEYLLNSVNMVVVQYYPAIILNCLPVGSAVHAKLPLSPSGRWLSTCHGSVADGNHHCQHHGPLGRVSWQCLAGTLGLSMFVSIGWFKGKFTGKSHISWEHLWFPVDFPFN